MRLLLIILLLLPQISHAELSGTALQKYEELKSKGIKKEIAYSLVSECKATAKNPIRCIKLGASIAKAESNGGENCTKGHNCFGMQDGATKYKSASDGTKDWVRRYNLYWYNQTTPSSFYRNDGVAPRTRYCMGPNRDGVCDNGYRNSHNLFNSLSF